MKTMYLQTLKMLIYIMLGFFFKKKAYINSSIEEKCSDLLIRVGIPCAILSSFINSEIVIPIGKLAEMILSVIVSFALLSVLGKVSAMMVCREKAEKSVWEYMILFSNNIYIGFPVIRALMGEEGIIYATLICIPCNALIFSYGIYLASVDSKMHFDWKKIINPSTIASVMAVVLLYCPMEIPGGVETIVSVIGKTSTPVGLLLLGIVIAEEFDWKKINLKRSFYFCFVRLVVSAFLIGAAYSLLWKDLVGMKQVMVLTAALPTSNLIVILSRQNKNQMVNLAIEGVVMSTGVYLVCAPLLLKILQIFF